MRRGIAAAALFGIATVSASQGGFEAIPASESSRYRIDFSRVFFSNPEAEQTDRRQLYSLLDSLEALKGHVGASAESLDRTMALQDRILILFNRHYRYLYLRNAVNTRDEQSLAEASALDADVSTRTAFLRQELAAIDPQILSGFVARRPSLEPYRFAFESADRYRDHLFPLKEEELLRSMSAGNEWPADLYSKLNGGAQRELYAFAITGQARLRTRLAQLHHFADAASEVYYGSYWTRADIDRLVETMQQHADLYVRYLRLRAAHPSPAEAAPRFAIDAATDVLRRALASLGAAYGGELAALLDPSSGRMDIVPGPNRRSGGFSQGFIGFDSVFFTAGFTGTYNDVRVLAHESTHAVQRQLMNHAGVRPVYAQGPSYLFEALAMVNEFLLPDFLYDHDTDPFRKRFYLEQFLAGKGTQMFAVAPEVAVEHAIYDAVSAGKVNGPDDLDALAEARYAPFAVDPSRTGALKSRWMSIQLMYEDPFYDANYVEGAVLGLNLYELYRRDPQRFVSQYVALMRNGFDATPAELMRRFFAIDLNDPALVTTALKVVTEKIDALEQSYRQDR